MIVDKDLLLNDLLGYIKLETLPVSPLLRYSGSVLTNSQASVVLVNESYPSDCIQFRSVLNPSQLRFRVQEASKPTEEEKKKGKEQETLPLVVESTSLNDLPLKPSRRQQALSPEFSQPSVEEDLSAATTEPAEEFASEEEDSRIIRERDALDDIIDQAKATSHLVNHVIPLLEAQATDLYT